ITSLIEVRTGWIDHPSVQRLGLQMVNTRPSIDWHNSDHEKDGSGGDGDDGDGDGDDPANGDPDQGEGDGGDDEGAEGDDTTAAADAPAKAPGGTDARTFA